MDDETRAALVGIHKKLDALLARGGAHAPSAAAPAGRAPGIATDAELDAQYGDPKISFPTNRWHGESYDGRQMSECPADFLLLQAEWLEQKGNNPKAGKERWARRDLEHAACARGWAARNQRNPPAVKPPSGGDYGSHSAGSAYGTDDEIPFASCDSALDPTVRGHRDFLRKALS